MTSGPLQGRSIELIEHDQALAASTLRLAVVDAEYRRSVGQLYPALEQQALRTGKARE